MSLSLVASSETLSTPEYVLKISDKAKILDRVDNGWETFITVEEDGQRARIRWGQEGFSVIFINATLRLHKKSSGAYKDYELTTDFEGKRYRVVRTPREVSWVLPKQSIFFRLYSGKVVEAVGDSDFLKITRNTSASRAQLESQAGSSDIILRKGKLEVFDGPEVSAHSYFLRGLAFHRGPVTLEIPLPSDPFMKALPPTSYLHIESSLAAKVSPPARAGEESLHSEEGSAQNPLQAEPSSWQSPVYRSNLGDAKEDPLHTKKERREDNKKDLLKAKTAPNSEDLLRVKDLQMDSTAP